MCEKDWLEKNRFYCPIDDTKLQAIFYFSLIWNIYEKELCDTEGSIGKHPKLHSQKYSENLDQEILNTTFIYFKNRYVSEGHATEHFNTFEFKSEPIKKEVFECLIDENLSSTQKLKVLLYIAFRLRNNLFHGQKQVDKLYEQNENFKRINLFLMNLIENK